MSLKRPLSPESNNNLINNDTRQLKRLKLHSIIQQLRNEEAKLILLKKLHKSQQSSIRTNKNLATVTNGFHPVATVTNAFHPVATRIPTAPTKPVQLPITTFSSQQQSIPVTATRKTSNSPLLINSNKISSNSSFEERKNQTKLTLNKQLERDLLNIPLPKPSLQDILFIPNGTSLEFQPFLGLEDVVQCLNELQNDRHRLPQRFTDHAHIDHPYICDQCGTDFTIRWWKHLNTKSSNQLINILCDRCKKQIIRRTSKSEHSKLFKNIFLSAIKQEKDIEKNLNSFIKQEKTSSSSSSQSKSLTKTTHQIQSMTTKPTYIPSTNPQYQTKSSLPQHFATKLSQQSTRKSNVIVSSQINHPTITHGKNSHTIQHNKMSLPIHHQQQIRSMNILPQQTKNNQIFKMPKNAMKQQTILSSSRSIFPNNPDLINAFLSSNLVRQTAAKRRIFPTVELK
jgi:hypothetical protein